MFEIKGLWKKTKANIFGAEREHAPEIRYDERIDVTQYQSGKISLTINYASSFGSACSGDFYTFPERPDNFVNNLIELSELFKDKVVFSMTIDKGGPEVDSDHFFSKKKYLKQKDFFVKNLAFKAYGKKQASGTQLLQNAITMMEQLPLDNTSSPKIRNSDALGNFEYVRNALMVCREELIHRTGLQQELKFSN